MCIKFKCKTIISLCSRSRILLDTHLKKHIFDQGQIGYKKIVMVSVFHTNFVIHLDQRFQNCFRGTPDLVLSVCYLKYF